MTSKCEICEETYTEDLLVSVGDNERFNANETISVVCSNCYEKHQCEGCRYWHTHTNMCEECDLCAEPSSHHRCCECETWNEECYDCDTPMTEKKLTEEEFDEYPDRGIGYGGDGEWRCGNCRSNEPWCYANSTRDTIENDRCICSVGGCSLPTEFDEPDEITCRDCDRSMSQLDANDIEMEDRGKYSICLDCKDERKSHIDNDCKYCEGNSVGRHAMFVGTKGYDICESCDINQAMEEIYKEKEEEDISHLTDKEYISHLEKKVEELESQSAIDKGEDRCGCGHCGK